MPSIENYLGYSTFNHGNKQWEVLIDDNLQTNLNCICELAVTIFDAKACRIVGIYPQSLINLAQYGNLNVFDNETDLIPLSPNETVEKEVTPTKDKALQILSPILSISESTAVYIELYRNTNLSLTNKDKKTLQLITSDIKNHLLQQQVIIKDNKQKDLHLHISQNNKDWIFVKDVDFKIVYANDSFMSLYPKDNQDQIIGFTEIEGYASKDADLSLKNDKIAFETGESIVIEELCIPNKGRVIVETIKRRFEDNKGELHILGICKDITEKEDVINQLKNNNSDLNDFTRIASHDLKSPLNAIRRLLEWIEEDCRDILPEESLNNLHLIVSRANRMHTLLDDLLSFSKIGHQDTKTTELSISQLLDDITPLLDIPNNFTLNITETELDAMLIVPLTPFKTVMLNVLGNAIKHNDKDNGVIDVSISETPNDYIIKVSDNGPGIEPKHFERVFQLLQTLKSKDEVEGSGIGLSVVTKHLNIFGGKIDIESDGKLGTTFNIYWPKKPLTP